MSIRRFLSVARLCADEERTLAIRSRWTQVFAVVFAVLALAVAASGYILSGGHGVQDFARTTVSLVQLVLLLVPLTALMLGVMALLPDRGTAELLYSQPAPRSAIQLGKLLGRKLELLEAAFVRVLSRARREGEVSRTLPIRATARALLTLSQGLSVVARVRRDPGFVRSVVEQARKLLDS